MQRRRSSPELAPYKRAVPPHMDFVCLPDPPGKDDLFDVLKRMRNEATPPPPLQTEVIYMPPLKTAVELKVVLERVRRMPMPSGGLVVVTSAKL